MENLSIQAVSQMIGITPFTLRAWEKRYRILKPKRSENGRRNYSLAEVEKLRMIVALRKAGHSMPDITSLNLKQLKQLLDNTSHGPDGNKYVFIPNLAPQGQIQNLMQSIQAVDMDRLSCQLKMLQLQLDTRTFLFEIVSPILRLLGSQVMDGSLEVFHEHAVSALFKHLLSGLLYSTERSTSFRTQAPLIFSSPESDHHEFGALMAAILAVINGHPVFYLGANMPADSLAKSAAALKSPLVVLACSAPQLALSSEKLRRYHSNLLRQLPETTALWIGGSRLAEFKQNSLPIREKDRLVPSLEDFDRFLRTQSVL